MKHTATFSCLFLLLGLAQNLRAQCVPQILTCPAAATVEVCDTSSNSLQFWNAPLWLNPDFGGTNLADAPVDLSISARDTCGNALSISYLLFLDLDGNGQQETVVSSTQPPPTSAVYFGNAANPNYTGGQYRQFDQRTVPSFFRYRFGVETQTVGGVTTARLRWRTPASVLGGVLPQLPYGKHRIRWTVRNAAGQESVCEYAVVVKDCGVPRVVCLPSRTVNMYLCNLAIPVYGRDFLSSVEDNYWPSNSPTVDIRRKGTGVGFPATPSGSVDVGCSDVGDFEMEVWVKDKAGNVGKCLTNLKLTDTSGFCAAPKTRVCLERWCDGVAMGKSEIILSRQSEILPLFTYSEETDSLGCLITAHCNLVFNFYSRIAFTPTNDLNPLEGVDQADLDRLARHLNGTQPFTETWQYIAADANKSGSITSFDLGEFKKLLDGIYIDLPNNTSWRFVASGFVFPNPQNPFQGPFPENITLKNTLSDTAYVMRGIKIGDLNCSLNFTDQLEERQGNNTQIADGEMFALPYPNPTSGGTTFLLQLAEASDAELTLSDLAGREVYRLHISGAAGENRVEIPASAFPQTGVYVWRVSAGGTVRAGRVVRL